MSDNRRMLVFLHIPKTAGTTLRSIIRRQYPGEAGFTTLHDPNASPTLKHLEAEMLHGHLHHGSVPDAEYFTMLREPVARVVSLYNFIRRRPDVDLYEQARNATLAEFIEMVSPQAKNGQTRLISGVREAPIGAHELAIAKANLRSFVVVGLQERFDESLLLFCRRLRWKFPVYRSKMVTHERAEISQQDRELVASHNQYDLELYDYARELFQGYRRGPLFYPQLAALKVLNKALRYAKRGRS